MSTLRWLQPAAPNPDSWNIYRDGGLIVEGVLSIPDAEDIYSTPLPGWPAEATYTMTAVNAHGESPHSNPLTLSEPAQVVGLVVLLLVLSVWMQLK